MNEGGRDHDTDERRKDERNNLLEAFVDGQARPGFACLFQSLSDTAGDSVRRPSVLALMSRGLAGRRGPRRSRISSPCGGSRAWVVVLPGTQPERQHQKRDAERECIGAEPPG